MQGNIKSISGENKKTTVLKSAERSKKSPETVAVRDYVSSRGYSGIVDWDGENPTVGGVKLKPQEIKDGTAYVSKADVDAVIDNMENYAGIVNPQKERDKKYKAAEESAFNSLINRKPFSYDPEKDENYIAYKKQSENAAEQALRRVLNDNNTSITGASGAVLSDAIAAYNAEQGKASDMIPELYEAAYKRYTLDAERDENVFETISSAAADYYDGLVKSNQNAVENISGAGLAERNERQRQTDNERNAEKDFYENALNYIELLYRGDDIKSDIVKTNTAAEKTAMDNAITRGFFVESDEAAIPWLKNYKTSDGGYSISPSLASVAYEYDTARAREKGKIHGKLGM